MPYRNVTVTDPQVRSLYDEFLREVETRLDAKGSDWNLVCRDVLTEIYFGGERSYEELLGDAKLPLATRATVASFDPRNVSLEPEYYSDVDGDKFARVKPLLWLWMMFDRSPVGRNMHLGIPLRRALARRVFKRCGKNLKIFHDVEFSYGYNMVAGDDCTIHRGVLIDDRAGVELGHKVSISDWANVYSHTHDILDIDKVSLLKTTIGNGARITYHSTVLAGVQVGDDAMVAACGLATREVPAHHVSGGIPARTLTVKRREPRPTPVRESAVTGPAD